MRRYVGCGVCKWRGKRAWQACECDYDYGCMGACAYGYCPKCHGKVRPVREQINDRKAQIEADKWAASPEGQAEMARLNEWASRIWKP